MHADVVVVGGGYAGLWTAWAVAAAEPDARVVVLEASTCGAGPSGRNAGFLNGFWHRSHLLCEHFGDAEAREICVRAAESVRAIGAWAESEGIDISYRRDGHLKVATSAAQDGAWDEAVAACARMGFQDECAELDAAAVRRRCASPLFRGGIWMPGGATVHPARLALGLRSALIARGVAIFERTRARRLGPRAGGGVVVETHAGARVSAPAAVLAINQATGAIRPLRSRFAVSATHMIVTEPVPDVLAELGWTGGEAISTARRYLYYFRTTADGRIAFGGAGRLAYGARFGGRVELDPAAVLELRAEIARMFPALGDRRIDAAWGGPIDVSPIHIPIIGSLAGDRVHYVCGFTGNGVGPAHLSGRILADLALDRRTNLTRLALVGADQPRVPPEPLRYLGGNAVRAALLRREAREDRGRSGGVLGELAIEVPRRLGIHL